jgi:hypothetical protein
MIAVFDNETDLLAATRATRDAGCEIVDVFTPYAVHGLDEAMGLRPSRLGWVCFLAGAAGAALALWAQYWTSAVDWPLNVGGKPFNSLPAFVPVIFELCVLFAALGVVLALLVRCGLRPGRRAVVPPGVTDDRFVLVARPCAQQDLRVLLAGHRPELVAEEVPA